MNPADLNIESRNLIGGQWVAAATGRAFAVTDPATDREIAQVPRCGGGETRQAIEAAQVALPAWRSRTAEDRGAILRTLADLMKRDRERLAHIMTLEQGKPLNESRGEINYAASFLDRKSTRLNSSHT